MLYITTAPFSLVGYHIKQTVGRQPIVLRNVNSNVLQECLAQMGEISGEGKLQDALYLLEWGEGKPPVELEQSIGNLVYVVVDKAEVWKSLTKKTWIEFVSIKPDLYRGNLEALRVMFTADAFDYFWYELCLNKFKSSPYKWNMELMALVIKRSAQNSRFTVEDLQNTYDMVDLNLFEMYLLQIGTRIGSQSLLQMSNTNLWTLFLGNVNRPPHLHRYLVVQKRNPNLYLYIGQLQEAVTASLIDLRTAAIVLNNFWQEEMKIQKVDRAVDLEVSSCGMERLSNLLYLS